MNKKNILGVFLVLALTAGQVVADDVLERARRFMADKDARAALALLKPLESARAGNVEYDLLLGTAALDAGDAQMAVFALERVVAIAPDNLQARAELARAHYALGEFSTARTEFQAVRSGDVPAEVKTSIDRFLSAIERGPTRLSAYIEASAGFDSNANNSTGASTLAVPGLGTVTLGPGATRDGDHFTSLAAGINLVQPVIKDFAVLAGLSGNNRMNGDATAFDTSAVDAYLGLRVTRGKNAFTGSWQGQSFRVDNSRYRDSSGFSAQWQHNYSDTRQASIFVQYADLEYPTQRIRDAERIIYGLGYATALPLRGTPVIFGSIYAGKEQESAPGVPHLGHKPWGVRLGVQAQLDVDWAAFVTASWEERRYGGFEPAFLVNRRDRQSDLRLGVNWRPLAEWVVTPSFSYTQNESTVALNRYDRKLFSVSVRREF